MKITCFILTLNEEKHIARAIKSLRGAVDRVVVIDSLSTDRTAEIAKANGAEVLENPWPGYAAQVNWAIVQISNGSDWLLRLDADEVLTTESRSRLRTVLAEQPAEVSGLTVHRTLRFLGRDMRFGGLGNIQILRFFRTGRGHCEARLMDEHIRVDGKVCASSLSIIDENLNSVAWMLDKYNRYSSLEAVEELNRRYCFLERHAELHVWLAPSARLRRAIKYGLYMRVAPGLRALGYFLFRYIFQFGFLDGKVGLIYHLMQGLVYRALVDAKVLQAETVLAANPDALALMLKNDLSFELSGESLRKEESR